MGFPAEDRGRKFGCIFPTGNLGGKLLPGNLGEKFGGFKVGVRGIAGARGGSGCIRFMGGQLEGEDETDVVDVVDVVDVADVADGAAL